MQDIRNRQSAALFSGLLPAGFLQEGACVPGFHLLGLKQLRQAVVAIIEFPGYFGQKLGMVGDVSSGFLHES